MAAGETGADADYGRLYFKPGYAIGWANDLGSSDFISTMTLAITGLGSSSPLVMFLFNNLDNGFTFHGPLSSLFLEGPLCKACLAIPDMMLIDCV